ncbi:MAG: hypothetical protein JJE28_10405, partial [Actinomycetales bacterium]|nr:hypothetical protein [Actinomycetales bacterium]
MGTHQELCGYKLGRYIPSRRAYVGSVKASGLDGLVHVERLTPEQEPQIGSAVLDVGRTVNGDLVLVRAPESTKKPGAVALRGTISLDETAPEPSSPGIMLFDRAATIGVVEKLSSPVVPSSSFVTASVLMRNLEPVRRIGHLLVKFCVVHIQNRRRLVIVFTVVGAVVTTVVVLGLGNGNSEIVVTEGTAQSVELTLAGGGVGEGGSEGEGAMTEVDPIVFAISEVRSGRVPTLREMQPAGDKKVPSQGGENDPQSELDGRVVSRNGDIVLVEVTLTA